MRTPIGAGLGLASLLLIAALAPQESTKGIPDTKLGLSKTSVFDTPAPEATVKNRSEPGERPLVARGFPEQPPPVPHGIDDYLPITLSENQCADCHMEEERKIAGEPTPIPSSHYFDLRAPKKTQNTLVGARYNCMSCHVSPGGNAPLTGNTFGD